MESLYIGRRRTSARQDLQESTASRLMKLEQSRNGDNRESVGISHAIWYFSMDKASQADGTAQMSDSTSHHRYFVSDNCSRISTKLWSLCLCKWMVSYEECPLLIEEAAGKTYSAMTKRVNHGFWQWIVIYKILGTKARHSHEGLGSSYGCTYENVGISYPRRVMLQY